MHLTLFTVFCLASCMAYPHSTPLILNDDAQVTPGAFWVSLGVILWVSSHQLCASPISEHSVLTARYPLLALRRYKQWQSPRTRHPPQPPPHPQAPGPTPSGIGSAHRALV